MVQTVQKTIEIPQLQLIDKVADVLVVHVVQVPRNRTVGGFGCQRVTPELVCYLPILTTFGWNGGSRVHTRPPGLHQGTTVCVHTSMDMEQQSDHTLIMSSGMGLLVCGAGSHLFLSPWCGKKDVPTGVNLNQYAGSGSFIRWHSDNEPLFGAQNLPKLIVSMRFIVILSLGNSVEFMVRRRASGKVPSSIRLDHCDVLVMDGLAQSEYDIARRLSCRVLGLTLLSAGLPNTLRPVH